MKACYINEFGDIDVLKVGQVPDPECGEFDAIIQTKAASLNHLDIWIRKGRPGKMSFPHILGSDLAGIVKEVGKKALEVNPKLKVGDEVVIYPGLYCNHCINCFKGEYSLCENYGVLGASRPGTFAEFVSVPARNVIPKPEHLSFEEAAAFPLTYLTAWRMLFTKAHIKPGQRVLIHGIGGGVAQAALKLALLIGAELFVTSSSESKLLNSQKLGAHHTILYTKEDIVQKIKKLTGNRGVDIVIDAIGKATMEINTQLVTKGGIIVLCGITTGAEATVDLRSIYWNQLQIHGSTMGTLSECNDMIRAVTINGIKPLIDSIYSLDKIADATARMEKDEQLGKIVLIP